MPDNSLRQCKPLLGTYVEIEIRAALDDDALLGLSLAAFAEIERVQQLMSFHDPESELSRVNATAHLREIRISPDTRDVLRFALELSVASQGLFDPTIAPHLVRRGLLPAHGSLPEADGNWQAVLLGPESVRFTTPLRLDLGGIAKGHAVDRALAILGPDVDATVNAGGDLAMTRWQGRDVGIRTPGSGGRNTLRLPMRDRALATSAAYFQGESSAIMHPHERTPYPGQESASVFASSCMVADALTKIVLLAADPAPLLGKYGAHACILDLEGVLKHL